VEVSARRRGSARLRLCKRENQRGPRRAAKSGVLENNRAACRAQNRCVPKAARRKQKGAHVQAGKTTGRGGAVRTAGSVCRVQNQRVRKAARRKQKGARVRAGTRLRVRQISERVCQSIFTCAVPLSFLGVRFKLLSARSRSLPDSANQYLCVPLRFFSWCV
jgi:hypothetical protein